MAQKKKNKQKEKKQKVPALRDTFGWIQQKTAEQFLLKPGVKTGPQSSDQDDTIPKINFPIFDDKDIKKVLKDVQQHDLPNHQVHAYGQKVVPIFCKYGYGLQYIRHYAPQYEYLTNQRYKTIMKAIMRRALRSLELNIQSDDFQLKSKMSSHQFNKIYKYMAYCDKQMPQKYQESLKKVLKQAYKVGPPISKQEGKAFYFKMKQVASGQTFFSQDEQDRKHKQQYSEDDNRRIDFKKAFKKKRGGNKAGVFKQKQKMLDEFYALAGGFQPKFEKSTPHQKQVQKKPIKQQKKVELPLWPDKIQFQFFQLMKDNQDFQKSQQTLLKNYPQNFSYFDIPSLKKYLRYTIKDFVMRISKECKNNPKDGLNIVSMNEKASQNFFSSLNQTTYNLLMKSRYFVDLRKEILKIYLQEYKDKKNITKDDIVKIDKIATEGVHTKIRNAIPSFNGDFQALDTQDSDSQRNQRFDSAPKIITKPWYQQEQQRKGYSYRDQFPEYQGYGFEERGQDDPLDYPYQNSNQNSSSSDHPPDIPRALTTAPKVSRKPKRSKQSSKARGKANKAKKKLAKEKWGEQKRNILSQSQDSMSFGSHNQYEWFHGQHDYRHKSSSRGFNFNTSFLDSKSLLQPKGSSEFLSAYIDNKKASSVKKSSTEQVIQID